MITLLLIVYTLIAAGLGAYLLAHQSRPFLLFDPNRSLTVKHVARYGGSLMLVVALASAYSIFDQNTMLIALVLASGCLIMMAVGLLLISFMQIR
ncbi:hypothetical protein [Lactiplantibacillus modestisalitolerans]|uniref:Integral membrane protein n=1 Tax=Lactiplantibacillus modestisalitolerans TaxID=1457219 RepID=A0ABV5WXH4_9LACO|nr:hypothetical protein [Lactiplantibacillus modestisalitolerans]